MWKQIVDIILSGITGTFGFVQDLVTKLDGFSMTWLYLFMAFTAYRLVIAPLLRASVSDQHHVDKPRMPQQPKSKPKPKPDKK